jgi:hypothetical protein
MIITHLNGKFSNQDKQINTKNKFSIDCELKDLFGSVSQKLQNSNISQLNSLTSNTQS